MTSWSMSFRSSARMLKDCSEGEGVPERNHQSKGIGEPSDKQCGFVATNSGRSKLQNTS